MNGDTLVQAINDFGFPVIAAGGLGYFVYYTWNWVVKEIKPVLDESTATLIGLIDRIRMLDNDMIRLNTKIQMILQEKEQKEEEERKENRKRNRHIVDTKL
jgi:hypothetical protein|tara:strand:- start:944 stop:1246 length:303 start_codon:yes stop_codon:yes gene_type:complete